MSLHDLSVVRLEPVPEVVAGLRSMLERAEAGEVRGYAIAASCDEGCSATGYVLGDGNCNDLIASLELVKLRLCGVVPGEP